MTKATIVVRIGTARPPARCQIWSLAARPSGSSGRCWRVELRGVGLGHSACLPDARAAGHRDSERFLVHRRRVLADDLAFVHDEDPVRQRQDLVQLEGDEEHGTAAVSFLDEPAVDELDRADVEPAGRLRGEQGTCGSRTDLAREDDLLLVAARQRCSAGRGAAAANVELAEQLPGTSDDPFGNSQPWCAFGIFS